MRTILRSKVAFTTLILCLAGSFAVPAQNGWPWSKIADARAACAPNAALTGPQMGRTLAPSNSVCIGAALDFTDPDYGRIATNDLGSGVGVAPGAGCSLSLSSTMVNYDIYYFNLVGCTTYPAQIVASTCGQIGACDPIGGADTVITLYRRVTSGDALTANGGVDLMFDPSSACNYAVAANDDLGSAPGVATSPGGSSCDQLTSGDCVAPCAASSSLSGLKRSLGSGKFAIVVSGSANNTFGSYKLFVAALDPSCTLVQSATASTATVSGRVTSMDGRGIANARVQITGIDGETFTAYSTRRGGYSIEGIPTGASYVAAVDSRRFLFEAQIIHVTDSLSDQNFVATGPRRPSEIIR